MTPRSLVERDRQCVWHPYAPPVAGPLFAVTEAAGVRLRLDDGRQLIDGMSSWWAAIHGYRHPAIEAAVREQLERLPHVMFGGLTHEPAVALCEQLCALAPAGLERSFLCDSGSVSVEVAIKLALQYWHARGRPERRRLLTVRGGYHGDTFAAMSVCDPVTGMHQLFRGALAEQVFAERPAPRFDEPCEPRHTADLEQKPAQHDHELAAVILEPIVQGAGGMWFYSPAYLQRVRELCDQHDLLLICDEIATGFGRTGKMFACEHAGIAPDIMCVGKAMTAGVMTLAATLVGQKVSDAIAHSAAGALMHGPTFMGNPRACAAAIASIELLLESNWHQRVTNIEQQLKHWLTPCNELPQVAEVRCLGAIGVIEMKQAVDMATIVPSFVEAGIWVRPFGKLVYLMPPFIIDQHQLGSLTSAINEVIGSITAQGAG